MAKQPSKKEKEKLYRRLKNHYKLVILNIDTFEERFAMLLTPLNVIVSVGIMLIVMITIIFALLAWTPLRYYLPGYAEEIKVKRMALSAALKADSMEVALRQREQYIQNFQALMDGRVPDDNTEAGGDPMAEPQEVNYTRSLEDSLLRMEIEREELVNLSPEFKREGSANYLLFPPVKGSVTSKFDAQREHFGIDIAAPKDASIKAIDEGTVIVASYTAETGYIIQMQHDNDLISVYKHNSVLLKKQGDKVRAGEAIAIIGETGEYSSGPHLHFELWSKGVALNPESYFSFD